MSDAGPVRARCGDSLAPIGRDAGSGGYLRYAWTGRRPGLPRLVRRGRPLDRGPRRRDRPQRQPLGLVGRPATAGDAVVTGSHLDSVPHGGALRRAARRRQSAFLAVDVLRERGRRARPGRSPSPPSPRRRAPGSASPASAPGCSPARSTRTRAPALTRPRRRARSPTRWRGRRRPGRAPAPTCSAGSARSSSCTSSRAGRWSTWTRRSAWPARSGRTAAGGSTSPARPTTPAPPGWPTAATRC